MRLFHRRNFKFFSLFVFLTFLIIVFFVFQKQKVITPEKTIFFEKNNFALQVEIANTPEKRREGLRGYKPLTKDQAMLFSFPNKGIYSFWMKGVDFPIDILWLDEEKKIVFIKNNARKEKNLPSYIPSEEALYVLETHAFFVEEHNVLLGDSFVWE